MGSFCIPRHRSRPNRVPTKWSTNQPLPGAVNVSFFDGHSELVKLDRLWQLYWHKDYQPPAKRPGLPWTFTGAIGFDREPRPTLRRSEDGVFGGLSDPEFQCFTGGDLDFRAGLGIAGGAGFAIHDHQFADAWHDELVFRMLVSELGHTIEHVFDGFFRDTGFFDDGINEL
jgi:prepilin-type processing-associated H-X9-DG protein